MYFSNVAVLSKTSHENVYLSRAEIIFKGTTLQIKKLLINDQVRVLSVSLKFLIQIIYNFEVIQA